MDTESQSAPIEPLVSATKLPLKITLQQRLGKEKRWAEAKFVRDQLMRDARSKGMSKEEAQDYTYRELEKRFPPLANNQQSTEIVKRKPGRPRKVGNATQSEPAATGGTISQKPSKNAGEIGVLGIGDIPRSWPSLPPNAQLAAEISWVQANRLRCVRESGDRISVDLKAAMTPAPSYSALGWLETSIRAYAKFVDVAAKATAGAESESEQIRREKMSIEEVRRMLAEMLEDGVQNHE